MEGRFRGLQLNRVGPPRVPCLVSNLFPRPPRHLHPPPYIVGTFPDPDLVLNLSFIGKFSVWGCAADCGGSPEVPLVTLPSQVPLEAAPFITPEELHDVVNKANNIMQRSYIPPCPVLCIPITIVCVATWYYSKTDSMLDELVEDLNNQPAYQQRGCYW